MSNVINMPPQGRTLEALICVACGERKESHVEMPDGSLLHPREARGEGYYRLVERAHIKGGATYKEARYFGPRYEFVPHRRSLFERLVGLLR